MQVHDATDLLTGCIELDLQRFPQDVVDTVEHGRGGRPDRDAVAPGSLAALAFELPQHVGVDPWALGGFLNERADLLRPLDRFAVRRIARGESRVARRVRLVPRSSGRSDAGPHRERHPRGGGGYERQRNDQCEH